MPLAIEPAVTRFAPPTGWAPSVGGPPLGGPGGGGQPIDLKHLGLGPRTLYGANGPQPNDIQQDRIGDCYLVATLGAVARTNPQAIRDMIHYDAKTGDYSVRLFDENGKPHTIRVTQAEVMDNILFRGGGSTADNTGKFARTWPAVIETAYAKMHDSNPADGLAEGYREISKGNTASHAMQAITGDSGSTIRYSQLFFENDASAMDRYGAQVQAALANGRPITLSTVEEPQGFFEKLFGIEPKQDGLADGHLYMVEGIHKNADGEWIVTLRNPWNQNNDGEGQDTSAPTVEVPLARLQHTGGGWGFTVGPAR